MEYEYVLDEESSATNCDVEESPLRDTCTPRDRFGEPVSRRQFEPNRFSATAKTHEKTDFVCVQLDAYSDQLDKSISTGD